MKPSLKEFSRRHVWQFFWVALTAVLIYAAVKVLLDKSQKKRPPKTESTLQKFEDQILADNGQCVSSRTDLSSEQIPVCAASPGFQPLGSYNPVGGFLLKCGCQHTPEITFKSFLVNFYKLTQKKFPQIPFTLVIDRACISSCYDDFIQGVGADAKFNTVFVDGNQRTNYFAQDAYISGVSSGGEQNTLLSSVENYGPGCPDLKFLNYAEATQKKENERYDTSGFHSSVDDRGGNVLPLPGKLIAVGDTLSPALSSFLSSQGNTLLRMEVKDLPARHIDEIVSILRYPKSKEKAPCDFLLVAASPSIAFELVDKKLHNGFSKELAQRQEQMIQRNLTKLQIQFKKTLGCKEDIGVIRFPIGWEPYQEKNQQFYKDVWPNPVNAQVIDQHMIIPDPGSQNVRTFIDKGLSLNGITRDYMDSSEMEKLYGGIHCASKFLHVCRAP